MNKIALFLIFIAAISCSDESKPLTTEEKKDKLKTYQTELQDLRAKIVELETEIASEDPDFKSAIDKSVLVAVNNPVKKRFVHKLEVRGEVASKKNVVVSAEVPGAIEQVHVNSGDLIRKGDKLISLNSSVIRNSIEEVKTSLEMAKIVYEKQKRLWDQNIGTEIQYLEAKNNRDALQNKLYTLWAQLAQYTLKAPFDGKVDLVNGKVGEMAQPGIPLVRLMSPNDMYITSDISENYSGKFDTGDTVSIKIPGMDTTVVSTVTSIGQVINEQNRTFAVEYKLPELNREIKPNHVVIIEITDYENPKTYTLPTGIILKDNDGKYVFKTEEGGDGLIAVKSHIEVGMSFNGETEIKSGLEGNENVIHQGFRELAEGYAVRISSNDRELTWK